MVIEDVPDDLVIDHLCATPACVNPAHLEPVTQAENVKRGRAGDIERARTHCPKGHPYDKANTYVSPAGHRKCRACTNARKKKQR